MKVCVLGSGIVGLATAYELTERGFEVMVIDAANTVGSGASGHNGAQLSYSHVQPLADASIWMQLPKLLLSSSSPFKLRPQWDLQQWRWGIEFLSACQSKISAKTTQSLLGLAALSRSHFDAMRERENIDCDYSSTGKLVLYASNKSFAAAKRQMQVQRLHGSQQEALDANDTIQIEPSLTSYQAQIAGSIYTPSECAIDTLALCLKLENILRSRGVQFEFGEKVLELTTRRNKVLTANTSSKSYEADQFVLALGAGSAELALTIGIRLPIYPLKGYSVTFDLTDTSHQSPSAAPRVNVTEASRKIVFARLGQKLRVAGMAELVGYDTTIDETAIAKLVASTKTLFPELKDCAASQPWAGLRPATPTGVPIIGKRSALLSNIILNTGHGALGLTLAFGAAVQVARLIHT